MRAPLKYLAPLILVPFLACADTPAEPEAEETTALFKQAQPSEPGWYIHVDVKCKEGWAGVVRARDYNQTPLDHAQDTCGFPGTGHSPWLLLADLTDPWLEEVVFRFENKDGSIFDDWYNDAYHIGWLLEEPLVATLPNGAVSWLVELVIVE